MNLPKPCSAVQLILPTVILLSLVVLPGVNRGCIAANTELIENCLGKDSVPQAIAQSQLPKDLLPSGVPTVSPSRRSPQKGLIEQTFLSGTSPVVFKEKEPDRPPKLLPEPEQEPGIVYVMPFTSVMVPEVVQERVFDQFVDLMNRESDSLGLEFVIFKQGMKAASREWLATRKYISGEIFSYVEDSGCCATDLRTKARISYYRPNQATPAFDYLLPVSVFFDHDQSSVDIERVRVADGIAVDLASKMLSTFEKIPKNPGTPYLVASNQRQ